MSEATDSEIIHRELDTSVENPAIQIVDAVADIEEMDPTELPAMYECADGMLDNLFSNPPAPEAQMEIEFCYKRYRITIDQDGYAKFIKTE